MIKLNRFNESTVNKNHNRLSVDEMEEYFIDFIDSGDLKYYHSGVPIGGNKIESCWALSDKFFKIIDTNKLSELSVLIKTLSDICSRWNLSFRFEMCGVGNKPGGGGPLQTQFIIIQETPAEIWNYFTGISTPSIRISLGGQRVPHQQKIYLYLKQDKEMNFYIYFELENQEEHKDFIIKQVKELIKIPMEFTGIQHGKNWAFKLLV